MAEARVRVLKVRTSQIQNFIIIVIIRRRKVVPFEISLKSALLFFIKAVIGLLPLISQCV